MTYIKFPNSNPVHWQAGVGLIEAMRFQFVGVGLRGCMKVEGGCRDEGLGFRVQGLGFRG